MSAGAAARITASVPAQTRRAYAGDFTRYSSWCAAAGRPVLPTGPEQLADYVNALADAGRAPSTIDRARAAIAAAHRAAGLDPPAVWTGHSLRRGMATARPAAVAPRCSGSPGTGGWADDSRSLGATSKTPTGRPTTR